MIKALPDEESVKAWSLNVTVSQNRWDAVGHFLDQMSGEDMLIAGFALTVVLGALGVVTNAILRESGFGVFVNGSLIVAGAVFGVAARGMVIGLQ